MRQAILVALAVCSVSARAQPAQESPGERPTEAPATTSAVDDAQRDASVRAGREHSVLREIGYGVLGYLGGGLGGGLLGAGIGFVAGLALSNGYLLLFGIAGGAVVGTGLAFIPAALNQGYAQFVVFRRWRR